MYGRIGLSVARSVEVEYLTERGSVFHQNVHTLIPVTINVMEMIMKRRNAMNNAVQVCYKIQFIRIATQSLIVYTLNSKTILGCMGGLDCL